MSGHLVGFIGLAALCVLGVALLWWGTSLPPHKPPGEGGDNGSGNYVQ